MMWNLDSETFMRNLYVKHCEAFIRDLHDKPLCETFMWNLNHSVELYTGDLEPLFVEPRTCKSETLC